jgi:hypothetical protein
MKRLFVFSVLSLALSISTLFAGEITKSEIVAKPAVGATNNLETVSQGKDSLLLKIIDKMPKVSGYLQTGWNYTDKGDGTSSFQAKRLRLLVDGNVSENVSFRLQLECFNGIAGSTNGNGQKNIQVMDAFATAKITQAFQIRAGQYYLPIGYENYDISPATLETVDFSNVCYRMVCRNAISYNLIDYGRDLGVMMLGDLLPNINKGFNYLSYNLSLTNGSLPCKDDNNKSKDVIASLTIRPIKNLNIKGSFNWGEYAGTVNGTSYTYQPMTRFVIGTWYNDPLGLDLRAEYGHIQGKDNGTNIIKEDGAYVLAGYHAGKFLPVIRYDMYRDKINKTSVNNYDRALLGLTYQVHKNIKLQFNYNYTRYTDEAKNASNDGKRGSNQIQFMTIFKF